MEAEALNIPAVSLGAILKKSGSAVAVDAGYIIGAGALMILAQGIL